MKASSTDHDPFRLLPSASARLVSVRIPRGCAERMVPPTFDMNLDIYGFVGVIMLIGIVKKNAIMMIDYALELQRNQDKTRRRQSIRDASCGFGRS
jgi:hypothetical protein